MKTDVQGSSTCAPGQEKHEHFKQGRTNMVQYDYRNDAGELFSTIAPNLTTARMKRDLWVAKKLGDVRNNKLNSFLESINAREIRETSWDIHDGKTIIRFMSANGYTFLVMTMVENDIITLIEIYKPAHQGSDFDGMFDAVRNYVNIKTSA